MFVKYFTANITPALMKIMQDKDIQELMVRFLNLRADLRDVAEAHMKNILKTLDLATKDEVNNLKDLVKELEDEIAELKSSLSKAENIQEKESPARRKSPPRRKSPAKEEPAQ
jgi:glutamine synthetase type III